MLAAIAKSPNPAAQYIAKYSQERYYLWDELAACAWLDPAHHYSRYAAVHGRRCEPRARLRRDLDLGEALKPAIDVQLVHAQVDLDLPRFRRMFIDLMSAPTPHGGPAPKH